MITAGSPYSAGHVTAGGQHARPAVRSGLDRDTAQVERDHMDIGENQMPAGPQDPGELRDRRAKGRQPGRARAGR
jgi:hypothetical protein